MSSIEDYNLVVQDLARCKGTPPGEKVVKFLRLVCILEMNGVEDVFIMS